MKRVLISILVLSCISAAAYGQEENTGWFVGAGAGMNFGFDGQHYDDRPTSHNGAGIGMDVYFGAWFNDWGGFRAGFQGLSISNKFTDFGLKRYEYVHADMLIRAHKNIIPYVHMGYVRIDNDAFGGGLGIAFPIHVTKRISIVPDFKATSFSNRVYESYRNNPAITLSATLGLCIQLGRRPKKGPEVAVQPVTVITPKTEIIHDTVFVTKIETKVIRDTIHTREEYHEIREIEKNEKIATISGNALFDTASDVLKEQAKKDLEVVVDWMREHPDVGIEVGGHTDSRGSEAYNRDLSLRRAQSVKSYLISCGIRPSLISVRGYGYSQPVATNTTAEGRQQNRRIEIRVR